MAMLENLQIGKKSKNQFVTNGIRARLVRIEVVSTREVVVIYAGIHCILII
jgi:hypothetical protein